jgi:hypothetical protein
MVNIAVLPPLTYLYGVNQSPRKITLQADRHIKVPKDKVAFLEFVRLVFDTGIVPCILEDKLEIRLRTSLDKIDRYFYKIILSIFRNMTGSIYLSSEYICTWEVSVLLELYY